MDVKRMTFKRPLLSELTIETKELILENNKLDLELYEYCLQKFDKIKNGLKDSKIKFIKNKYNHVIPYAAGAFLFEFCMDNKKFIKQNFVYFKELTFFLLKKQNVRDGFVFTKTFNTSFINSINEKFPNSEFVTLIKNEFKKNDDPLEQTVLIANAVDYFFKSNKNSNQYYNPLQFDKEKIKVEGVEVEKSFFKRLFKK